MRERIFSTVVSENGSEIPLGKQCRVTSWHRGLCRDQGLSVDLGCHLAVILCDFSPASFSGADKSAETLAAGINSKWRTEEQGNEKSTVLEREWLKK